MLVDEWQRYPPVWDRVRRDVDRRSQPGRYLLTGSAEPTSAPTRSGAGRIVTVRMRPLSLAERDLAPRGVSLTELMSGRRPPISGEVDLGLRDNAREIVGSGFPGLRGLPRRVVNAALDGYLDHDRLPRRADQAVAAGPGQGGVDEEFLLSGQPLSGRVGALRSDGTLVESLVTQSVRTYAQHCEASVGHLRTCNGDHEVDLVVQGFGRKVVAIEVKISGTVEDRDVRHLRWLADRLGDALLDAVVFTAGRHAYRRRDGITVVPAAMLGP